MFFKKFRYLLEAIFFSLRLRKKSSFALRVFKIKIHFYPLDFRLGGDGNCYTVIPPNHICICFLASNCHTRHGISVLHISLVDSDELYITFGFILLIPINFRHSFGCHTVSFPPDRPKAIYESFRLYTPLIPQAVDVPFLSLCVRRAGQALSTMEWTRTTIKGVSVEYTLSYVNKLCRLSYHCIWLGRRDLNSL